VYDALAYYNIGWCYFFKTSHYVQFRRSTSSTSYSL